MRPDLAALPVVDGHCHPLLADPWALSPDTFADLFTEGRPGTMSAHVPHTAYFRRAVAALASHLGTEPRVEAVLGRRRALGPDAARHAFAESNIAALLVDTGYPPEAMPLAEMRRLLPCPIHEVFRVETCAQRLLGKELASDEFLDEYRRQLEAAASRCVALKSIIAYRSGLRIQPWTKDAAAAAYGEALRRLRATGSPRLTDKPLLDLLFLITLEIAQASGRPLQLHTGFGDPDIDLLQANPLLLRPLLEDPRWAGVRIVLLHMAYPYFREAAFMTAVWPQVYLDLSLALPFLGPGAVGPLIEVLALAPASKLLYGSDLRGLPELLALAADWGRVVLAEALGGLEQRGDFTVEASRDIAGRILAGNAQALYGLSAVAGSG